MTKPLIKLFDGVGTGLIIACKSGVRFSNQTGGTGCHQPEIEGVYIPLRNDYLIDSREFMSPELKLAEHFTGPKHLGSGAISGLDHDDADLIDEILKKENLYPQLSVNRWRLKESHEAWVFVTISRDESPESNLSLFTGFDPYPRDGILTWANSD